MLSSVVEDQVMEHAQGILQCFLNHPEESKGLEEIARWRLLQQQASRTIEGIRRAEEMLDKMDLLQQQSTPAGGKRYSIDPSKLENCRKWLGGMALGKE